MEKKLVQSYENLRDSKVLFFLRDSDSSWDECVITKASKKYFYNVELFQERSFENLCINWYNKFRFVFGSLDFVFL